MQGSVGLRVSPATDGALSRLQDSIDVKKVFLEVRSTFVATAGIETKDPHHMCLCYNIVLHSLNSTI